MALQAVAYPFIHGPGFRCPLLLGNAYVIRTDRRSRKRASSNVVRSSLKPTSMRTKLNYLTYALIAAATVTACKKDDDDPVTPAPPPVNEEEVITTVRLHFHSANDVEHKHFEFSDPDGAGGAAPVISADTLSADSIYHVHMEILDESGSTVEDITAEIEEEGDVHQFFFQVSGANATVVYGDVDANGLPIGLETQWTIGAASNGSVMVTLRHEPDKTASGVSTGDITNAGGETDIEVTFPVVIE